MRCVLFAAIFALGVPFICSCVLEETDGDDSEDNPSSDDDGASDDDDTAVDDDASDDDVSDDDETDDDTDDDADDDTGPHDYVGAVVGYISENPHYTPIIWRDDHGTWTQESLPASTDDIWLRDVYMIDAQTGWAGGMARPAVGDDRPVLYQRTATGWAEVALDPPDGCIDISDLDFLSADYGWAICGYGLTTQGYEYDGTGWTAVDIPGSFPFTAAAFDLVEPDHVYVAGVMADMGGLAEFYEWKNGTFVNGMSGSWFDWYDGVAVEDGDGWLASGRWRASFYPAELFHLVDGEWEPVGDLQGYYGSVSKFARTPSGIWFAAAYGAGPAIFRYVDGDWELMPGRAARGMGAGFFAMDVKADDFAAAAGASYYVGISEGPGLVMTYRGSMWRDVPEPSAVMNAVYEGVSYVHDPR